MLENLLGFKITLRRGKSRKPNTFSNGTIILLANVQKLLHFQNQVILNCMPIKDRISLYSKFWNYNSKYNSKKSIHEYELEASIRNTGG